MSAYQTPMLPWPGLELYAPTFHLPRSGLELFAHDTADRGDKPPRSYTIAFLCNTLRELVEQMRPFRVFLTGHSMGAVVAQTLALEQPTWLESQALIDGTLLTQEQRLNPQLLFMLIPGRGEWWYTRLRKDSQAAYATLQPYYHQIESLPDIERQILFQRVNQRVWDDARLGLQPSTGG